MFLIGKLGNVRPVCPPFFTKAWAMLALPLLTIFFLHRNFTLFHHPMYGNCYTFNNKENETIHSTSMGGSEYGKPCPASWALDLPEAQELPRPEARGACPAAVSIGPFFPGIFAPL